MVPDRFLRSSKGALGSYPKVPPRPSPLAGFSGISRDYPVRLLTKLQLRGTYRIAGESGRVLRDLRGVETTNRVPI